MKHEPAPIKGHDLFKVLYGSGFKFDRKAIPAEVNALTEKIEKEYAEGHVKGAVNIPYGKFDEYRKLPENKVLVLYCDRGGASLMLARQLAKKGYMTRSVIGGFRAYRGRNLVISS